VLDETRRPVTVRCGTRDRDILREIFVDQAYAAPPEVDEILKLPKEPRIVDLGANIGLFGLWMLSRWPSARIHSFEPDPDNLEILDRNIADARTGSRWIVARACAAPADGRVHFLAGQQADSRTVYAADPTSDVLEVPAVDVFPHLQNAELLKIDIEGGEWPLLADARFRDLGVPAIVLEEHAYNCPHPGESSETARRLLEGCGYTVVETHRHPAGAACSGRGGRLNQTAVNGQPGGPRPMPTVRGVPIRSGARTERGPGERRRSPLRAGQSVGGNTNANWKPRCSRSRSGFRAPIRPAWA
jgi:FkbM family methyltransferase